MPCSVAAAPMTASMHGWKPMDSTGRHRKMIRPARGTTTLVEARYLSIVKPKARSREHLPFGVSGTDPEVTGAQSRLHRSDERTRRSSRRYSRKPLVARGVPRLAPHAVPAVFPDGPERTE